MPGTLAGRGAAGADGAATAATAARRVPGRARLLRCCRSAPASCSGIRGGRCAGCGPRCGRPGGEGGTVHQAMAQVIELSPVLEYLQDHSISGLDAMLQPRPAGRLDLDSEELGSTALTAFFNITQRWGLSAEEERTLLGSPPRSTFFKWKSERAAKLSADTARAHQLRDGHLQGAAHPAAHARRRRTPGSRSRTPPTASAASRRSSACSAGASSTWPTCAATWTPSAADAMTQSESSDPRRRQPALAEDLSRRRGEASAGQRLRGHRAARASWRRPGTSKA